MNGDSDETGECVRRGGGGREVSARNGPSVQKNSGAYSRGSLGGLDIVNLGCPLDAVIS